MRHDFLLTRLLAANDGGVTVQLRLDAEVLETSVAIPRPPRCLGIDFRQIAEHGFDRAVHAVKVEPVKPGAFFQRPAQVPAAQPFHELEHDGVAPHPSGKAAKITQRDVGVFILAAPGDVAMHAKRVRPIRLQGDRAKSLFFNQPPGELRARGVKLVRAMRSFADEDALRVARFFDEPVIVTLAADGASRLPHDRSVALQRIRFACVHPC